MKVEQIMTRDVLTIGPEGEVRDVARILVESHISGLPVCNAQRQVVGVISEGDILFREDCCRGRTVLVPLRLDAHEGSQEGSGDQGSRVDDRSRDHDFVLLLGRRGRAAHVRARRQPSSRGQRRRARRHRHAHRSRARVRPVRPGQSAAR